MTIVLTGTLTCWRHASNDDIVCAVSGQWETRSLFHMYVLHCCLLSLYTHVYHINEDTCTPYTFHCCPKTRHEVGGLLSWLKHVGYTVLWYQLEGGWKSCQYFHYLVFFRAETGEAWSYRQKDFHTPSSWYQRAVYLTGQEQQWCWWAQYEGTCITYHRRGKLRATSS